MNVVARPFLFLLSIVDEIGSTLLFLREILWTLFHKPCRVKDIVDQTWSVTMQSLPTTAMAGFFVGVMQDQNLMLRMQHDFSPSIASPGLE